MNQTPQVEATRSAPGGVRAHMRAAWERLRGGELTPWRAGTSVAVGLAIGVTPLYGAHLALVMLVCIPLRLDTRLAYLVANVSNPFFAPLLCAFEIQLGAFVRTGAVLPVNPAALEAHGVGAFAADLATGTLLFAPPVSLAAGLFAFAVTAVVPNKSDFGRAVEAVARRYPGHGDRFRARAKLATDPVARKLFDAGSVGEVVDLGCGAGYMSMLLVLAGQADGAIGIDVRGDKTSLFHAAAKGLPIETIEHDLRTAPPIPACDTVLLIDVLHYLPPDAQDRVLRRAARAARNRVFVREIEPRRGVFSEITRLAERFRVRPATRPSEQIAAVLEAEGLRTRTMRCDEGTPFANVLIVAERN